MHDITKTTLANIYFGHSEYDDRLYELLGQYEYPVENEIDVTSVSSLDYAHLFPEFVTCGASIQFVHPKNEQGAERVHLYIEKIHLDEFFDRLEKMLDTRYDKKRVKGIFKTVR